MSVHYQKIFQTTNYDLFAFIKGNRPIKRSQVDKLKESIQRDNRLFENEIKVTQPKGEDGPLYVHDGQHRLQAAKELKLPIFYKITENPYKHAMIDDQIQLPWDLKDRLNYYKENGYQEYIKFHNLMTNYSIPFTPLFALLGWHKYNNGKTFKEGKLIIHDKVERFVIESFSFRKELLNLYDVEHVLHRRDFISALFWFWKTFHDEFTKLTEKLKNCFPDLPQKATKKAYEERLISLYNSVKGGRGRGLQHPDKERRNEN